MIHVVNHHLLDFYTIVTRTFSRIKLHLKVIWSSSKVINESKLILKRFQCLEEIGPVFGLRGEKTNVSHPRVLSLAYYLKVPEN